MNRIDLDNLGATGRPKYSRQDVAFLSFLVLFIVLQLYILSDLTPIYFESDHLLPVSSAMRLLSGEVMYRDFFHFTPPGAELWYASLFTIFGIRIDVLNLTILILAVSQLFVCFYLSKKLFTGVFVYVPSALYFAIGFRLFGIDGSNRLFSVIFVLIAAAVLLTSLSYRRMAIAGTLCGLGSFFVHTRGLLGIVAIAFFLVWTTLKGQLTFSEMMRKLLTLSLSFAAFVVFTNAYFAYAAGWDNFYFANITFLKDHYGSDTLSNTFAYLADIPTFSGYVEAYGFINAVFRFVRVAVPTLLIYALVPFVYLIFYVTAYRRRKSNTGRPPRGMVFLSILGLVLFVGSSAPTGFRLYQISIPAMIVTTWLIKELFSYQVGVALLCAALLLCGSYSIQRQVVKRTYLELPAGRTVVLSKEMAEKYRWLTERTRPGELLFEAHHPSFYFPLHLKNPTPFYLVRDNNYTPDFQVDRLVRSLEATPPRYVVWEGKWSKPDAERLPGDNLGPLWKFIDANYDKVAEFPSTGEFTRNSIRDIEIWERRGD